MFPFLLGRCIFDVYFENNKGKSLKRNLHFLQNKTGSTKISQGSHDLLAATTTTGAGTASTALLVMKLIKRGARLE